MPNNQIVGRDKILTFMLAGNALFTLQSKKTGDHFTYRVKKQKEGTRDYFVLAGHGGYLGRLVVRGEVRFFPGIKPEPENIFAHKLPFAWFINHLDSDKFELWHEGKCGKCGRRLTDPQSIERGLGPECSGVNKSKFARHKHKLNQSIGGMF